MRRLIMSSASLALIIGAAACAATPPPAPAPDPEPEVVVEPEPEIVEIIEEALPVVATGPTAGSLADFNVNVGDRVYFDLDQYRLNGDAQDVLRRQAAWLGAYPNVSIMVAGNCDERGTREYNLALGERRASIVKTYLVDLGVDPARIQTVSYGKERPLAVGANESAWQQNRNGFTQIIDGAVG